MGLFPLILKPSLFKIDISTCKATALDGEIAHNLFKN